MIGSWLEDLDDACGTVEPDLDAVADALDGAGHPGDAGQRVLAAQRGAVRQHAARLEDQAGDAGEGRRPARVGLACDDDPIRRDPIEVTNVENDVGDPPDGSRTSWCPDEGERLGHYVEIGAATSVYQRRRALQERGAGARARVLPGLPPPVNRSSVGWRAVAPRTVELSSAEEEHILGVGEEAALVQSLTLDQEYPPVFHPYSIEVEPVVVAHRGVHGVQVQQRSKDAPAHPAEGSAE